MVETQLVRRGIADARVLEAMRALPRRLFVPDDQRECAYADHPIGIACGQTISQPYMAAAMTELLHLSPEARVLEIGVGSGYQTALLARLAAHVTGMERHAVLAEAARYRLQTLSIDNVEIYVGDGTLGCPANAPYDAILVAAAAPGIPASLKAQLAEGGRLVAPIGGTDVQRLAVMRRQGDAFSVDEGLSCRFVPLIGAEGWPDGMRG